MATTRSLAAEHYRKQQRLVLKLLVRARQEWGRLPELSGEAWAESVGPRLVKLVTTAQVAAAMQSADSTAAIARVQRIDMDTSVQPMAFAGVASDGRPLESLLYQSITAAKAAPVGAGRAAGWQFLNEALMTQTADAARGAGGALIAATRTVQGYVRMPGPGACARCAILAGRFYRYNTGFDRHPRCMCVHVPSSELRSSSYRTDPSKFFDRLSRDEQDRRFTRAGAQAIRDGADVNQVVNARRGMRTAQVYGQDVKITTEGTTRRGVAYRSMKARGKAGVGQDSRATGQRYARTKTVRIMPDSIYKLAVDREDAIRMLKLYGFIV